MIEKPFGYDLASARELNACVLDVFEESQVFRIDHYLGKETVQNLMALRFANALFEPVWNCHFIDHVQITAAEDVGDRGSRGLLRAGRRAARPGPEPHAPAAGAAGDGAADAVRGQSGARREGEGARCDRAAGRRGRRHDVGRGRSTVREWSEASRFRATARRRGWRRTRAPRRTPRCGSTSPTGAGRACRSTCAPASGWPASVTEIAVTLKRVPHLAFQSDGSQGVQPNQIILMVQPDEGVSVSIGAKIPGRGCGSVRCIWSSTTAPRSCPSRPRPTSG